MGETIIVTHSTEYLRERPSRRKTLEAQRHIQNSPIPLEKDGSSQS